MPVRRGFDYYFGVPYSADMSPLPLYRNTEVLEEPARLDLLASKFTQEALDFIARSKDSAFFLYMPLVAPHPPQAASERFRGKSPAGIYGDMVEELDWGVGQIVRCAGAARPFGQHAGDSLVGQWPDESREHRIVTR